MENYCRLFRWIFYKILMIFSENFENYCEKFWKIFRKFLTRQRPYHCLTDRVIFSIRFLTRFASGHTTVSQNPFFFNFFSVVFDQDVSGHTTVCQTVFLKDILDCESMTISQSHRPGPWNGHWCPRSKKWYKKNPVCETVVWPLTLKKPGPGDWGMVTGGPSEKPECWRPLSIKTFPYW